MIEFDIWWNSAAADPFRAKNEDMDGEQVRPVWDAAVRASKAPAEGDARAEFEDWYSSKREGSLHRWDGGGREAPSHLVGVYLEERANQSWKVWQAAWKAAQPQPKGTTDFAALAAHWLKLGDQDEREGQRKAADAWRVCAEQLMEEAATQAPAPAHELMGQLIKAHEQRAELRQALEVIALGDAADPVRDAGDTLVELGWWSGEALAASRAETQGPAVGAALSIELTAICGAADAGAGGWVSTSRIRELLANSPTLTDGEILAVADAEHQRGKFSGEADSPGSFLFSRKRMVKFVRDLLGSQPPVQHKEAER